MNNLVGTHRKHALSRTFLKARICKNWKYDTIEDVSYCMIILTLKYYIKNKSIVLKTFRMRPLKNWTAISVHWLF